MKRFLSVFLAIVMLLGIVAITPYGAAEASAAGAINALFPALPV